jgi:hypothetical protein
MSDVKRGYASLFRRHFDDDDRKIESKKKFCIANDSILCRLIFLFLPSTQQNEKKWKIHTHLLTE